MSSKKPSSMSSLFATKGAASPSSDAIPRGDEPSRPISPSIEAERAPQHLTESQSEAANQPSPAMMPAPSLPGGIAELVSQLAAHKEPEVIPVIHKITINVKLRVDLEQKLKRIVGFEKMKRMTNFSQQDWLESRLEMLIEHEYSKLPKI